jgi:hypothetical protein
MFHRNDKYIYFALIPIIATALRRFLHFALQQNEIVSPLKFYKYYTSLLLQANFQYFSSRAQNTFFTLLMYGKSIASRRALSSRGY